jgi:Tol biopolymer transport system component
MAPATCRCSQPGHDAVAPAPSPDLTRVAYVVPGPDELYLYDLAPGTATLLAPRGHTPVWSPNGEWIAYVVPFDGTLRLVRPSGTDDRSLGAQVLAGLGFDWSPDGAWLVVRGPGQLALVEVATGLTLHLGYSGNWMAPAWQR